MKYGLIILAIIAALPLLFAFSSPAAAMDDPGFIIKRMVLSEEIVDREPVAAKDTFSAGTDKVYCFLEAAAIENDTMITFVWYFEDREMARMTLPLLEGKRWRTYASKKIAGMQGNWKVELLESTGIVLHSISFRVE